jgi:hypothetical protein
MILMHIHSISTKQGESRLNREVESREEKEIERKNEDKRLDKKK